MWSLIRIVKKDDVTNDEDGEGWWEWWRKMRMVKNDYDGEETWHEEWLGWRKKMRIWRMMMMAKKDDRVKRDEDVKNDEDNEDWWVQWLWCILGNVLAVITVILSYLDFIINKIFNLYIQYLNLTHTLFHTD